jgi:predicted  nucleic acid-binding Zn-ribbon protein
MLLNDDNMLQEADRTSMNNSNQSNAQSMRHLDLIMDEIRKAKQDLVAAREKLLAERENLDKQLAALERELGLLDQMDQGGEDAARPSRSHGEPLSRRVLEVLQQHNDKLTFREMREWLNLDRRESRNLGPVLNQLAKMGKITSDGRGTPWRLVSQ